MVKNGRFPSYSQFIIHFSILNICMELLATQKWHRESFVMYTPINWDNIDSVWLQYC